MKTDRSIGYGIKASWHMISRMYNSYAIHYDISISMGFVLLILSKSEGMPSTHIAPSIGMESRSLTRLLKSMDEKGLIRKHQDEIDRRQVLIYLTEEGYSKRKKVKETIKTFNKLIENDIPLKEIEVFFKVLDRVNKIAENNHLSTE